MPQKKKTLGVSISAHSTATTPIWDNDVSFSKTLLNTLGNAFSHRKLPPIIAGMKLQATRVVRRRARLLDSRLESGTQRPSTPLPGP